ncbi:aromatic prenyltransferase [Marinactinospora thermotolerans]|uniref:Aromatic prenyltransferase Orf2 n=1 Tax=Marinactinospora thermotolerans DSM 45154 TaxID=1122192 RepID=A0A1T4SRP6_9ACTN|nr:aromatic prenyltransferase [Marinactinospora thermotolerans]SKA30833.1 Aromatic prenyltransferase Orf2 [Marinactinospora thermotolerans DSM 45154]
MNVPPNAFSPSRFIKDVQGTATSIGAAFDQERTRRVIDAYEQSFSTGAVLWKTTSRAGDALSYRFYSREPTDTVEIAARAGFIDVRSPLVPLVTSLSAMNGGAALQSCDFDADRGLAKCWVFLGGMLRLEEVLAVDHMPEALRRQEAALAGRGLEFVRHVSVDFRHQTVNLYFGVLGRFRAGQQAAVAELVHSPPADAALVEEIGGYMREEHYLAALTWSADTGCFERACFYAPHIPEGRIPDVGPRLAGFLRDAPSYDPTDVHIVGWSFGAGGTSYVKGERSYCGDLAGLLRDWRALPGRGGQAGPVLDPVATP